jgi:hypothetical protein
MRGSLKIAAWCAGMAAVLPAAVIYVRSWVNTASADRVLLAKIAIPSYPPSGSVDGTVIDAEGKPVAGAVVYASIHVPGHHFAPKLITGPTGRFEFGNMQWGPYFITAGRAGEGPAWYPLLCPEFLGGNRPLFEVDLAPGHATATMTIRLGPKAGRVTGKVTDARTSAPLPNSGSELKWASDPSNVVRSPMGDGPSDAKFSIAIPSNTDVLWKVLRDGYQTWYYPGTTDESAATALRLRPGQVTSIAIRLQPEDAAEKTRRKPVATVAKP